MINPIIEISNLSKTFGKTCALRDVSFSIKKGEIFGIIGPDGAGKTTLIKILSTLISPSAGKVEILGVDALKNKEQVRPKIGYLSQGFSLYGELTVEENIEFFSSIHSASLEEEKEWYEKLLTMTALQPFMNRRAQDLSGGMKQKLSLLCALAKRPEILILDEPTSGVDPISRRELWKIFYDLWKREITIIISTPYLDEAERCTRVAALIDGKLIACETPEHLKGKLPFDIFEIYADQIPDIYAKIRNMKIFLMVKVLGEKVVVYAEKGKTEEKRLQTLLRENDIAFKGIERGSASLEDFFMELSLRENKQS